MHSSCKNALFRLQTQNSSDNPTYRTRFRYRGTNNRMTRKTIDKYVDYVYKKLLRIEAIATPDHQQQQSEEQQKQYELGEAVHAYEQNLNCLANLPEDFTNPFTGHINQEYVELQEKALQEIKQYEDMLAETKARVAAEDGATGEEVEQFWQQCKQYYLAEVKKKQDYQKNVQWIVSNDYVTEIDHNTDKTRKWDIYLENEIRQ
jgi:hypothetical protein